MKEFLKVYREIAENLYPASITNAGIDVQIIETVEKRRGLHFPRVLKDFYLLVGNHESINYSHNELISIDCLDIEDNKIIFYQENQGVCYWGIDLKDITEDDPPVWIGQSIVNREELDWHLAAESLSGFFIVMLCWQSVMGGLPMIGSADDIDKAIEQKVVNKFTPVEVEKEYSGLRPLIGKGQVICLAQNDEKTSIYAGAVDENRLLDIENSLGIEWNYTSLNK